MKRRDEKRLRKILGRMVVPANGTTTAPSFMHHGEPGTPVQHLAFALLRALDDDAHNAILSASAAIGVYRTEAVDMIRMADQYGGEYGEPLPKDNPDRVVDRATPAERAAGVAHLEARLEALISAPSGN